MHQKLGHAYTQRSTVDDAWREYLTSLHIFQSQEEAEQNDLLCNYIHLSELGTRWLGFFESDPDMQEVHTYIDAGLKLLEGEPPSGDLAELLTYRSLWYVRQFKPAQAQQRQKLAEHALQYALEGLRVAEESGSTISIWIALDALGFIYGKQHKYTEAHATQHRRQSLQDMIKGRAELYDLYESLGHAHLLISDYPTAASWFGHAWRIAQTMESPSMLLISMRGRLQVWYDWNRADEACEAARGILQASEQYQQDRSWQLHALEVLAELTYRAGKTEESEKLLRQYRHMMELCCPNQTILMPGVHAAHEHWELALADMREIVRLAEPFPSPEALAYLAEFTVLALEPAEEQETACERAVHIAQEAGARKFLAVALRARGRMHIAQENWSAAEQDLRRALDGFKELDLPWEQGETLACLGCLHRQLAETLNHDRPAQEGRCSLARFFFQQSLGFFESLHAVHDARRMKEMLALAGAAV